MVLKRHVKNLIRRYPQLEGIEEEIINAYLVLEECYRQQGKLLIAGNGGSAADSEHMAGELMKKFKLDRPVSREFAEKLKNIDPEKGENLARNLQPLRFFSQSMQFYSLRPFPLICHSRCHPPSMNSVNQYLILPPLSKAFPALVFCNYILS